MRCRTMYCGSCRNPLASHLSTASGSSRCCQSTTSAYWSWDHEVILLYSRIFLVKGWPNVREAEFIAGFYHYLLQNSADPQGITIYNGQRKRILIHIKSRPHLAHHYTNVVIVDSYQGEENVSLFFCLCGTTNVAILGSSKSIIE